MGIFGKKQVTKVEKNNDDNKLIRKNYQSLQNVLDLYGDQLINEIKDELQMLVSIIQYLSPSSKEAVLKIDQNINELVNEFLTNVVSPQCESSILLGIIIKIKGLLAIRKLEE